MTQKLTRIAKQLEISKNILQIRRNSDILELLDLMAHCLNVKSKQRLLAKFFLSIKSELDSESIDSLLFLTSNSNTNGNKKRQKESSLRQMPKDIFYHITSYLPLESSIYLSITNHTFHSIVENEEYWNKYSLISSNAYKLTLDDTKLQVIYDNNCICECLSRYCKHLYIECWDEDEIHCQDCTINSKCILYKLIESIKNGNCDLSWFASILSHIKRLHVSNQWHCAFNHLPMSWIFDQCENNKCIRKTKVIDIIGSTDGNENLSDEAILLFAKKYHKYIKKKLSQKSKHKDKDKDKNKGKEKEKEKEKTIEKEKDTDEDKDNDSESDDGDDDDNDNNTGNVKDMQLAMKKGNKRHKERRTDISDHISPTREIHRIWYDSHNVSICDVFPLLRGNYGGLLLEFPERNTGDNGNNNGGGAGGGAGGGGGVNANGNDNENNGGNQKVTSLEQFVQIFHSNVDWLEIFFPQLDLKNRFMAIDVVKDFFKENIELINDLSKTEEELTFKNLLKRYNCKSSQLPQFKSLSIGFDNKRGCVHLEALVNHNKMYKLLNMKHSVKFLSVQCLNSQNLGLSKDAIACIVPKLHKLQHISILFNSATSCKRIQRFYRRFLVDIIIQCLQRNGTSGCRCKIKKIEISWDRSFVEHPYKHTTQIVISNRNELLPVNANNLCQKIRTIVMDDCFKELKEFIDDETRNDGKFVQKLLLRSSYHL